MSRTSPTGTPFDDDFHLYDTTLRDGAQQEGIAYSVEDKLAVARLLDDLGVGFVEAGWPGALPKDSEFFRRAADGGLPLRHAALVAFGSTRRPGRTAVRDEQVLALLDSEAPVVTLVAKADRAHIERALRTDVAENLAMVAETVRLLVAEGRRVFLDAEHFFDGYARDADVALRVLDVAIAAGADVVVLCDTNGAQLPSRLGDVVGEVVRRTGFRVGVHCHDDTGCAVANTMAAVQAGAMHVQGTANGYGERTGNANLFTLAANLETKLDCPVLLSGGLAALTSTASAIAEIAGIPQDPQRPYVGASAFAHKAGLHASAIKVDPGLYNHLDPAAVGNRARILVSEMAGRSSMELKARELGLALSPSVLDRAVQRVKVLEADGWSFEAADASLELLLRAELGMRPAPLTPLSCLLRTDGASVSEATVCVQVGDVAESATAVGSGPVEAVDAALRATVVSRMPDLGTVRTERHSIRTLTNAMGDRTRRVQVVSQDGPLRCTTVGAHPDLATAALRALCDALAFHHLRGTPSTAVPAPEEVHA